MTIRAVLFDWGGTLMRDAAPGGSPPAAAVARYARHQLHLALRDEVLEAALDAVIPAYTLGSPQTPLHVHAFIAAAFQRLGWTLEEADLDACARLFFDEATFAQDIFDDARAILSSLKHRGYVVGVVTNSIFPAAMLTSRMAELGVSPYIDALVSSADAGAAKPDPRPYHQALSALGVTPQEALFVGDTLETDIAGARAAGLRAVLLDRSGRRKEAAGYLVIARLGALNDLLGEGAI